MTDVSGNWLGTYWQQEVPTRFEATLLQSGNTLSGNILDDGSLGEANLSGSMIGRSIQFTKRYLSKSNYSITYTGTVSATEDFMHGEWRIGLFSSGRWEAHRSGENLMIQLRERLANQISLFSK